MNLIFTQKSVCSLLMLLFTSFIFSQSNNDKARAYFNQAQSAFSSRNYSKTITYVNTAEQLLGATNPILLNLKVKAFFGLKEYYNAKKALDKFSKVSSKAAPDLVNETLAYVVKIDDAIMAEKARKEKERLDEIKRKEAAKLAETKKKEAKRLTEAKKNEELRLSKKLSTLNDKNLNDKDFLSQLDKSSKEVNAELINPSEIEVILRMFGYKLMDSKKYEKALIVFKYTTRLNPYSFQPWVGMAKCYFKIGDYEKSEEYFKKTYSIEPGGFTGEYVKKQLALIPEMRYKDYVKNALVNYKYLDKNNNITSKENAVKYLKTFLHPKLKGIYVIHEYSIELKYLSAETQYKIIPNPFKPSIKHGWSFDNILGRKYIDTFYYNGKIKQQLRYKFGVDNEISFTLYSYKGEIVYRTAYSNIYEASFNSLGGYESLKIADANMKGKRKIEYKYFSFDYNGDVKRLYIRDRKDKFIKKYTWYRR